MNAERMEDGSSARTLDEFHDLDFRAGVITNRRSERRMLMLTSGAWASLDSALRKAFGEGATTYMRAVGFCIGTSFGQDLKAKGNDAPEIAEILPAVGESIGWGRWSFRGDKKWERTRARVENCPSCTYERPGTPPMCDLLVGVLNGLADEIFERPHVVTETRCGYKSGGTCEFAIAETLERPEEQKYWASFAMFPWLRGR